MKRQKKKQAGITLIALVISIIVMLILAGVSINATIGENGIVTQAQLASMSNRLAGYKEELEMNIATVSLDEGFDNRDKVTALNEYVLKYIPSIKEDDLGLFGIIGGELYYLGTEENEIRACINQGINVLPEGMNLDEFSKDVEGKAIENVLKSMTGDSFVSTNNDGESTEVGIKLYDKTVANSARWRLITEVKNNDVSAIYGTGWTYVEAGNVVDGLGKLKQSYIINFSDRLAVKFDGNIHTMLSYNSGIAVTRGMVFNFDPLVFNDLSNYDETVSFEGFDDLSTVHNTENISSGFSKSTLYFDGEDDQIVIRDTTDYSSGVSFSFYANSKKEDYELGKYAYTGLFSKVTGESGIRFGIEHQTQESNPLTFFISASGVLIGETVDEAIINQGKDLRIDEYLSSGDDWRIATSTEELKNGFYIDFTMDPSTQKAYVYINGELVLESLLTEEYYNNFLIGMNSTELPLIIGQGRAGSETNGHWYGSANSIRIYNRALTSAEIKANYNATVSYHQFLVNGGIAGTGGNTGGDSY